jgi:hypothetical protein
MGNIIKKFEAFVGDDGELQGFDKDKYQDDNYPKNLGFKGEKDKLEQLISDLRPFLESNNITIHDNEGTFVLSNENDDMYSISKDIENDGDGYLIYASLTDDGSTEEYLLDNNEEVVSDIQSKLLRSNNIVPYVDLMKYGFKRTDAFASENEEEITEKKSKSKNSEEGHTTLTTPEASIKNNKGSNFEPTKGHADTNPWYKNVISKRIEIGSKDPVKSFQQWSGKYWRKKGEENLKYEPNSGVPQKEKVKSI